MCVDIQVESALDCNTHEFYLYICTLNCTLIVYLLMCRHSGKVLEQAAEAKSCVMQYHNLCSAAVASAQSCATYVCCSSRLHALCYDCKSAGLLLHKLLVPWGICSQHPTDLSLAPAAPAAPATAPAPAAVAAAVYMAPEVISGQCHSISMDVWAAGIMLYQMLTAQFPFWDTDMAGLFKIHPRQILKDIQGSEILLNHAVCDGLSESAKDLIQKMLAKDPTQRISADAALRHPWLQQ